MSSNYILTFIVTLICIEIVISMQEQVYVYQKDISEHCRRRATPSVFLGRHVIASNSKTLHFSRKDLPYSCSITIRAESGSNIIMMVQLLSEDDLVSSCADNNGQLVVSQMGETFGGYWGSIPDVLIRQPKYQNNKIYTHKITTTAAPTSPTRGRTRGTTKSYNEIRYRNGEIKQPVPDKYIKIDVPLVNITFDLVPGVLITQDSNMRFDDLYDVTPIPGVKYDTTLIPIAEINVGTLADRSAGRKAFEGKETSRLMPFTPDFRLAVPNFLSPVTRRKPHIKDYKYNRLSKLKPRKPVHKKGKTRKNAAINSLDRYLKLTGLRRVCYRLVVLDANVIIWKRPSSQHYRKMFDADKTPKDFSAHSSDPKNFLDKILELYEANSNDDQFDEYKNLTMFLQNLTDAKFNNSAYLYPHIVSTTQLPLSKTVKQQTSGATTIHQNIASTSSYHVPAEKVQNDDLVLKESTKLTFINRTSIVRTTTIKDINETDYYMDLNYKETEFDNKTEDTSKKASNLHHQTQEITTEQKQASTSANTETLVHKIRTTTLSTNLVDHESWENVVQAAPVMAILLNQTVSEDIEPSSNGTNALENNVSAEKVNKRTKRFIEMVPIENARPRQMTTSSHNSTVFNRANIKVPDMQDFAQLVEIQDDEIQGRVALRYIRNYVGPTIYNICDFDTHNRSPRSVYLFNSSRIVISLHNFSMERMTLILTPGRTVLGSNSVCPENHLECQVTGARVCIDSINACDGLPNCGVYDIYDEDRVRCGRTIGLEHNVALASFAFVAVLLTALYGVHYWLKRCVPAVSDAFFVYINGADNILYLESIMRAPLDMNDPDEADDVSKQVFHSNLLQNFDEELFKSEPKKVEDTQHKSIFSKLIKLFRKKQNVDDFKRRSLSLEIMQSELDSEQKPFSFAEYELSSRMMHKDIADAAVQTGTSLELSEFHRENLRDLSARHKRDLFLMPETSQATLQVDEPLEDQGKPQVDKTLDAMRLFRQPQQQLVDSSSTDTQEEEMHSTSYEQKSKLTSQKPPSVDSHYKKHLRFDEKTILIDSEQQSAGMSGKKASSVSSGKIKAASDDNVADDIEKDNKIDFRRFWKGKKVNKKKQQQLSLK